MLAKNVKKPIIYILITSLIFSTSVTVFANPKDAKKVRIAFWQPELKNLNEESRKKLLQRFHGMFKNEPSLVVVNPEVFDADYRNGHISDADSASIFAYAKLNKVDYVFRVDLANQGREKERVLLVGELQRYDIETGFVHRFEVLKYYDHIGIELQRFRDEYVRTIVPESKKKRNLLPVIVLGSVALAGILAMTLTFTGANATGNGGNDRGDRTP